MKTLHITNGDGAAEVIKKSAISGDVLPWRDPMHHGPFPAGLDLQNLSRLRAKYLASPNINTADAEREFELRDMHLQAAPDYDQVLLWFEHDLLDQLQVLQILDWLADANLDTTTLEIICVDNFPGIDNFRGIGQLDEFQMASLYSKRRPVSAKMLAVAQLGWAAFRSDEPRHLLEFAHGDLTGLPYLKKALLRHFEEYPNIATGLSRTESQIMSLVKDEDCDPVELFTQNMNLESSLYIGDWLTYSSLDYLCNASLVSCSTGPFWHPPHTRDQREAFRKQRFGLTEKGMRILCGEMNAFGILNRDFWLGGVHLRSGREMWVWNPDGCQFVERNT